MLLLRQIVRCSLIAAVCLAGSPGSAQTPGPEQVLRAYRPRQPNVGYDIPKPEEIADCRVEIERKDGHAGFVVYGPAGQVLRRFVDTNGDQNADRFHYYRYGLEVYRDIDSNFNRKPDQYRWMNWGGTRWGIDHNEDGRIDEWKRLSAPEAAQVAVQALIAQDAQLLSTVLISRADVQALRVNRTVAEQLLKSVRDPAGQLRRLLADSRVITRRTKWARFDPPIPGLIPADGNRYRADLMVYENAMAIVQNGERHDLVSIGEMVRVGDVWKLTQLPRPLDDQNAQIQLGGVLMQPSTADSLVAEAASVSEELQQLFEKLEAVDNSMPGENATPAELVSYNRKRADLIERIIPLVDAKQREEWVRQYADGLAAAVQTGQYVEGLKRLTRLQEQMKNDEKLLGHIWYRRLLAEYAVRLQSSTEEQQRSAVQEWWLEQLEQFARRWPKSDDAADAIIQLAISLEIMGRIDDARAWYTRLATDHPRTNGGLRARGALRRLDLTGRKLQLAGRSLNGKTIDASQYQGKVLLVVFWASWATPYAQDLPAIEEVYARYRKAGFEVLGVNLDANASSVAPFIEKYGGRWQHIRDAGGTDGKLAREFGIVSVPTMFLVDRRGIVAGGITTENLAQAVETLLQNKPLGGSAGTQGSASTEQPRR